MLEIADLADRADRAGLPRRFFVARKLYHLYFILMALIFIFVIGLNFMLAVLFGLFLPSVTNARVFFFVARACFKRIESWRSCSRAVVR